MSLIYLIIIVLLLVLIVARLMYIRALDIKFVFDTENKNVNLSLTWLYPFFRASVVLEDDKPMLTVYLFNKKVYKKAVKLKKQKNKKSNLLKSASPTDINILTSYGFKSPYVTGIVCGAMGTVQSFVNVKSFTQYPDFSSLEDHIYVNLTAKVNAYNTLKNMRKNK